MEKKPIYLPTCSPTSVYGVRCTRVSSKLLSRSEEAWSRVTTKTLRTLGSTKTLRLLHFLKDTFHHARGRTDKLRLLCTPLCFSSSSVELSRDSSRRPDSLDSVRFGCHRRNRFINTACHRESISDLSTQSRTQSAANVWYVRMSFGFSKGLTGRKSAHLIVDVDKRVRGQS